MLTIYLWDFYGSNRACIGSSKIINTIKINHEEICNFVFKAGWKLMLNKYRMNEEDKSLHSTLSTSPLLFWAANETETVWEKKQTHNQSQAKGIEERRGERSCAQAGNDAKRGRQWDDNGRALLTTPCLKEKTLSSEGREGCWTLLSLLRMGNHEPGQPRAQPAYKVMCSFLVNSKFLPPFAC